MNGEVQRTDMKVIRVGPSGLNCLVGDSDPDLTVGAISSRPCGSIVQICFNL
jgi:hypothetical protein